MKTVVLSVHGLVDFLLRKGSIDTRIYNNASMAEGTRIHLRYQQIQNGNYLSEQELSCHFVVDDYEFVLSGRADGIIVGGKKPIIDEIKSTVADLEEFYNEQKEWHLGQAKVYAYMYALEHDLEEIGVRLTYISQTDNDDKLILNFSYYLSELKEFLESLLKEYIAFYRSIDDHNKLRITSSSQLEFPFETYREGQRELAKYVYGTILNDDTLFIEAPTGIGKTMSTLFPAVKSFSTCGSEKIFYLSAKKIAKDVAFEACKIMMNRGLKVRTIKLSSKEKMCQTGVGHCNPDECPFALGYYDNIRKVLSEIISSEDIIDEDVINKYANRYEMCAFELQLDVSLFADVIICDYNYLFDPLVYLKRYFDEAKTSYVALIDETHNLVDRSRDMYSISLSMFDLLELQKSYKKFKHIRFKRALTRLIVYLKNYLSTEDNFYMNEDNFDDEFYLLLNNFFKQCQDILKNYQQFINDEFNKVFKDLNRFLKISEFISHEFRTYFEKTHDENVIAHIQCVDSSKLVKKTISKLKSAIFFSATLTPIEYYVKCLGGNDDTPIMKLDSPFPKENLLTLIRSNISTRYRDREFSYVEIAKTIESVIKNKIGNYLVFFSSYQYLENVFNAMEKSDDFNYIKQTRDMDDKERVRFLSHFNNEPSKTTIGFAVLGGVFSEGIDLVADKLIGAIVVGVGLPQISYERDLIKDYFNDQEMNGYDYSYVNPGITKIIQAAGRVIRSESDVGVVCFIDDRYRQAKYQDIFKKEFKNSYFVTSTKEIDQLLEEFWKNK